MYELSAKNDRLIWFKEKVVFCDRAILIKRLKFIVILQKAVLMLILGSCWKQSKDLFLNY